MFTDKYYYKEPFLHSLEAEVTRVHELGLIFNRTIAYAEGGGQIGDIGDIINLSTGKIIKFTDTTKVSGRVVNVSDFPSVTVDNDIIHHIKIDDNFDFKVGHKCIISIDLNKRINTSFNHTAIHIALMAAEKIIPNIRKRIYGAHINENYGRLDFKLDKRLDHGDMILINEYANEIVNNAVHIEIFPHKNEPEALFWKCDNFIIPCGGTHAINTLELGEITVKRKNVGKNAERLIATFKVDTLPIERYYNQSLFL